MVIHIEEQGRGPEFTDPQPDESLSSWVRRNPRARFRSPGKMGEEHDFGELLFDLPSASKALQEALLRLAQPPGVDVVLPERRTYTCDHCDLLDWAAGRPLYRRRAWALRWRSTCELGHGPLSDRPFGDWRPRSRKVPIESFVRSTTGERTTTNADLRRIVSFGKKSHARSSGITITGPRGAYLENALCESQPNRLKWCPKGLELASLRAIANMIAHALMGRVGDRDDDGADARRWNFQVSVFTEAILAEWTNTPLPRAGASHWETRLLVKLAGWPLRFPSGPTDRIRCPLNTVNPVVEREIELIASHLVMTPKELEAVFDQDPRRRCFDLNELARLGSQRSPAGLIAAIAELSGEFSFDRRSGDLKLRRKTLSVATRELLGAVLPRTGCVMPPMFERGGA